MKISSARVDAQGGRIDSATLKSYTETAVGGTGGTNSGTAYTVDLTTGNVFHILLNANCTFTFPSTLTSGTAYSFILVLKQDGGTRTATWPSSVIWPGGTTPVLSATGGIRDIFTFMTINGGTSWLGFAGGLNFAAAAASTAYNLFAWGRNNSGQLGLGDSTARSVPVQVGTLTTWSNTGLAEGNAGTRAIKTDNTLWTWGTQSALGDAATRNSPVQVGGYITWSAVTTGNQNSLGLKSDGTLWAWGTNGDGDSGLGDVINRSVPTQVGTLAAWSSVGAGNGWTAGLRTDGTLWTWGNNGASYSQLGLGDNVSRSSPVQVGTLATWSVLSVGDKHGLALKNDGTLWGWGDNTNGSLGIGTASDKNSPVQVGTLATWSSISAGNGHSVVLKTDNTLWAWGSNTNGRLGLGDTAHRSSPVQVGTLATWSAIARGSLRRCTLALQSDNTLWAWGKNSTNQSGDLGLGDAIDRSSPVQVGGGAAWAGIAAGYTDTLALQDPSLLANSQLFSWGSGTNGALGLDDTANRSSPTQVGTIATWSSVSDAYFQGVALKSDGSLWGWGKNAAGTLGVGDSTHRSSPTQVGGPLVWASASGGYQNGLGIRTDGTLWSWGYAGYGALGLGNTTPNKLVPTQVGTLTTWAEVSAALNNSFAIKTDGTLWAWGYNRSTASGLLGLGDTVARSSPVQIGALATWASISVHRYHAVALKTDGTLWAWGVHHNGGSLGLGDIIDRSSPVQVGTLTTWSFAAAGTAGSFAIKTDGTLWAWGSGNDGELGLGDIINRSSPVQVGTLATWSRVSGGSSIATALKTDGTLWSWGGSGNGQMGLGDVILRSSPVQVGTLATWTKIATGNNGKFALLWPPTTTTTAPGKPTAVIASVGSASGTAVVVWTAPLSFGGKPISQYTVTSSPGSITATTNGTFATVSGLTTSTTYTFTVTAANSVGTGSASAASNSIVAP